MDPELVYRMLQRTESIEVDLVIREGANDENAAEIKNNKWWIHPC